VASAAPNPQIDVSQTSILLIKGCENWETNNCVYLGMPSWLYCWWRLLGPGWPPLQVNAGLYPHAANNLRRGHDHLLKLVNDCRRRLLVF
jgi:hypothetical protein